MFINYNGTHSITFWKADDENKVSYHSYEDFGLIPQQRPYFGIPTANYQIVGIPNSSDRINITDTLPGGLTFGPIQGEWSFFIDHEKWSDWATSKQKISDFFNGKRLIVRLDEMPDEFYEGRFSISKYEPGAVATTVGIKYDLDYAPIEFTPGEDSNDAIRLINSDNKLAGKFGNPPEDMKLYHFFGN